MKGRWAINSERSEGIKQTIKRNVLIAGMVAATGLTVLTGVSIAAAQSNTASQNGIVDKIASKFNLNKDEVQKIFDENRASHEAEHKAEVKEKLDNAVKNGKLTQDQEDKILTKQEEMKTFMESLKDKTPEERKTAMDAKRDELTKWAEDNNIAEEYLHFGGPRGGHKHEGMTPPPDSQIN